MYGSVTHLVAQPSTLAERCAAARILAADLSQAQEAHVDRSQMAASRSTRVAAAHTPIPVFVDGMDNGCSHAFGALPERLAIVSTAQGGEAAPAPAPAGSSEASPVVLRWLGGKGPEDYSVLACRDALDRLLPKASA
jgi:hypothetical protein